MKSIKNKTGKIALGLSIAALLSGGVASAAGIIHVGTANIRHGAVTKAKLAKGAVGTKQLSRFVSGELTGTSSPFVFVPDTLSAAADPTNKNPDSDVAGAGGWYYSGDVPATEAAGDASVLAGGDLELFGSGVDTNSWQGGVGLAKAFDLPLSRLVGLNYNWTVTTPNGQQAPAVHVTLTGATADSKFSSGFTNLVLEPSEQPGLSVEAGVSYHTAGTFAIGAASEGLFFSTDEPAGQVQGSINDPQPLAFFLNRDTNATVVQISVDNGGSSNGTGTFSGSVSNLAINNGGAVTNYIFGQ